MTHKQLLSDIFLFGLLGFAASWDCNSITLCVWPRDTVQTSVTVRVNPNYLHLAPQQYDFATVEFDDYPSTTFLCAPFNLWYLGYSGNITLNMVSFYWVMKIVIFFDFSTTFSVTETLLLLMMMLCTI